jgi:hypothetical protein
MQRVREAIGKKKVEKKTYEDKKKNKVSVNYFSRGENHLKNEKRE